jgi:hypothetical protein
MSAYCRFIPREIDHDAAQVARAAKPAKAEAGSRDPSANAMLRPANRGDSADSDAFRRLARRWLQETGNLTAKLK